MGTKTALFVRKQSGGMFTVVDESLTTGDIWWVDAGSSTGADSAGYGQNPDAPCLTLDYAVGLCTANSGDVIYCMPGHAENLAADSDVDIDVAGIKVIGLGYGADRPTFTATATTGDFKLAAASTWVENILVLGGIDQTSGIVEVSGTDCTLKNIEYRDSVDEATDMIMVVDGADRLTIDGYRCIGAAGAGANSAIAVDGADDLIIRNWDIYGNFAVGAIDFRTHASARAHIHSGKGWTANAADIIVVDTVTGSTGTIGPDIFCMLKDNAANITTAVTGATFQVMDPIYVCNLVDEKGMLIDWTASTHA